MSSTNDRTQDTDIGSLRACERILKYTSPVDIK